MKRVQNESMLEIMDWMEEALALLSPGDTLTLQIPDPDTGIGLYSGTKIKTTQGVVLHHSWKSWYALAELLYCRMLTPRKTKEEGVIELRYQKLNTVDTFHSLSSQDHEEKYGSSSKFSTIHKNEEPSFLFAFKQALQKVNIGTRKSLLDLGINSGDEFDLIRKLTDEVNFQEMDLIGIDHNDSAIEEAKYKFPEAHITFHCHDINDLDTLQLPKVDLLLSIGTLQSTGINFKPLFMSLIQKYLKTDGAVILGFPNCRWIDGEMLYGARAPHYNFPEMSLVIKDIHFCKKYLQQHKFRVTVTGKEYLFLTATRIGMGK